MIDQNSIVNMKIFLNFSGNLVNINLGLAIGISQSENWQNPILIHH